MFNNVFKKKEKEGDTMRKLVKEIAEINQNQKEAVKQLELLNEKLKELGRRQR